MKLIPMRYKGFEWHHNPKKIEFFFEKNTKEFLPPYGTGELQELGERSVVIKGEGELYGTDCLVQFGSLYSLFKQKGSGVLAIEGIEPIFAVFEKLAIAGEPKPDLLSYRFVFREDPSKKKREIPSEHIAGEGEDLWDIAYKYTLSIDTLVRLNPEVKRPDVLEKGMVIKLC